MTNPVSSGTLVISLDLEAGSNARSAIDEAALATIDAVLALLRDARMPATWCSSSPASCPAVAEVSAEAADHEIALKLVQQGRTREVVQQVKLAQRAGQQITTMLADTMPDMEWLANICRLGLTAVSLTSVSRAGHRSWLQRVRQFLAASHEEPAPARQLRYGLWEVPAASDLPVGRSAAQRTLEITAACGDVLHVNTALSQIRRGRAGGLKSLERLVQAAFELRNQRGLEVCTIANLVARLRADRTITPAQSILRRAA